MIPIEGKSRVIIENVQPQVDGGLYPAKRTIGERVDVTADIFGDGHDHIRARLLYKKEGAPQWLPVEMTPSYNDNWHGSFTVTEKGTYEFTLMAWVDHFDTWYDGFKKKAAAKVDVHLELREGVQHIRTVAADKHGNLKESIRILEGDYNAALHHVQSPEFGELVHNHPLITHETTYAKVL